MTMALLVLASTVSFTVEKRYCHDNLIAISVFTNMMDCDNVESPEFPIELSAKKCCKDEIEIFKGQDVLKNRSLDDLEFEQRLFLSALIYSYTNLFEGLSQNIIPHKDYSPPNLISDIQILAQVFLI